MSSNDPVTKVTLEALRQPRLKADRADKHINELIAAAQDLPRDLYDLSVKLHTIPPHAKPSGFQWAYKPLKPIPETFALMIGDAIYNLRAALDYLASAIVRTVDSKATPYFPFSPERDNLKHSADLVKMENALPGSTKLLLDEIRPVNDGRNHLWRFNSIYVNDKHNLVVPTVAVTDIHVDNAWWGGNSMHQMAFSNDATKPFILVQSRHPITVQGEPHTSVAVSFGPGTPFEGELVIPTLLSIRNLVAETLDSFERLIVRVSARPT